MLHHFAELHPATEVAMNHDEFGESFSNTLHMDLMDVVVFVMGLPVQRHIPYLVGVARNAIHFEQCALTVLKLLCRKTFPPVSHFVLLEISI